MPVTSPPTPRPPLDAARLREALRDTRDLTVEVVEEAASTNVLIADRAREGAPDGLVLVAEYQSAGRGRLDRTWETPPGSALTFSVLLRPTSPTRSWPWLPLLTGYAVGKALEAAGYDAGVKWPNDVLIGERKVAGILVEQIETGGGPAAVVGVGLNTDLTRDELPVPTATALSLETSRTGDAPDRTDLLVQVLLAIREAYDAWQVGGDLGGMPLAESYAQACVTVGRKVRVDLPDGSAVQGQATSIDPGGHLMVRAEGVEHRIGAGDVVHVRSVP